MPTPGSAQTSQADNAERVREAYAAFGRRDPAPLLAILSDDVEWIDPLPSTHPVGGTFHGKSEVQEYFRQLGGIAEFQAFELVDLIAAEDKVVAFIHLETTMRHNGRRFAGDSAHVWTFRDGLAVKYRIYADTAGIMAAFQAE